MTKSLLIQNVTLVNDDELKENLDVYIENSKIKKIGSQLNFTADEIIEGTNRYLFPGYIDMHIHGSAGKDTMDATQDALHTMAKSLIKEGTTSFLATTITQSFEAIEAALRNIAEFRSTTNEAEIIGVHLEGPYISKKRAGAQPLQHIVPSSIEQFEYWQQISGNLIKEITVAPEVEGGFGLIETLAEQGIIVSIGHSDATFDEMKKAVSLGAKQGTHLYNQMRPFHHREPGVVGGTLLLPEIKAEIIADFVHVHPQAINLTFKMKGAENIILITDAMRAKGVPYGDYDLGGQLVHVTEKGAHLLNGALAGSTLTMDVAVRNMKDATNCSLQDLVAMSSSNAAKQMNLNAKGRIKEHYDADLILLDKDLFIIKTIKDGKVVFG